MGVDLGLVLFHVARLHAVRMPHGAHHVRVVVPAFVGEDRGEVGHLQGHHQHFALADAHAE